MVYKTLNYNTKSMYITQILLMIANAIKPIHQPNQYMMRIPNGKEGISINMSTANFDILTTMLGLANIDIEFNSFGQSLKEQMLVEGKEGDLNIFVFSE